MKPSPRHAPGGRGIGLPRLHEAREAPSPLSSFPFFSPGRVILRPPGQLCRCSSVGRAAPWSVCAGSIPANGNTLRQKRRMDAGKNGAQIAGWKRAGLQARPIKTHPSVSSSRDGWPDLSQSTTVDGAHSTFIRPQYITPTGLIYGGHESIEQERMIADGKAIEIQDRGRAGKRHR